jgi:hypothetical protein
VLGETSNNSIYILDHSFGITKILMLISSEPRLIKSTDEPIELLNRLKRIKDPNPRKNSHNRKFNETFKDVVIKGSQKSPGYYFLGCAVRREIHNHQSSFKFCVGSARKAELRNENVARDWRI